MKNILSAFFVTSSFVSLAFASVSTNPVLIEIEKRFNAGTKNFQLTQVLEKKNKYSCTQFFDHYGKLETRDYSDAFIYFDDSVLNNFGTIEFINVGSNETGLQYTVRYTGNSHDDRQWEIAKTDSNSLIVKESTEKTVFGGPNVLSYFVCDLNKKVLSNLSQLAERYAQAKTVEISDLNLSKSWTCEFTSAQVGRTDKVTRYGHYLQLEPFSEAGITVADLYINKSHTVSTYKNQFYKAIRDDQGQIVLFQENNGSETIRTDGKNLIIESLVQSKVLLPEFHLPSIENNQARAAGYAICN